MKRSYVAAAALVTFAALAGAASAQINPFHDRGPKLTGQDLRLLNDSAAKLQTIPPPPVGESSGWRNPRTGAHGTTSLMRVYRYRDMICHALRYRVSPTASRPLRTYDLDWCRTPDGPWRIKS